VIGTRAFVLASLIWGAAGPLPAVAETKPATPATEANTGAPIVALEGKLKHPQSLDLPALLRLPAEQVQVSFEWERGATTATYTGARLWAVLVAAGGIDDDEKGAELRHLIRGIGRDGYLVVLSTGEIAPDFGGKPALLAYQRNNEPPGEAGLRLVMPGEKRGGRNVRDVVAIRVE
jgi:hypothetical protein